MGEHLPCKQGVMGSNPIISTSVRNTGADKEKHASSESNLMKGNVRMTGMETMRVTVCSSGG